MIDKCFNRPVRQALGRGELRLDARGVIERNPGVSTAEGDHPDGRQPGERSTAHRRSAQDDRPAPGLPHHRQHRPAHAGAGPAGDRAQ
ncbi:MAG: hypothetical protein MZW92_15050 [Comamonadaceae bacterium]|nr:hypothetical protein [Comamonadaceae bacterium]